MNESVFIEKQQLSDLVLSKADTKSSSLQDIVDAILNPQLASSSKTMRLVNASVGLRRLYKESLSSLSEVILPALAAASSSLSIFQRRQANFELRVSDDSLNSDMAILLVTLHEVPSESNTQGAKAPSPAEKSARFISLQIEYKELFYRIEMQAADKLKFQGLIDKSCVEYQSIIDPDSNIYVTLHQGA